MSELFNRAKTTMKMLSAEEREDLNSFQKKCLNRLLELLERFHIQKFQAELIKGQEEKYLEGKVLNVDFWIYLDGVDIRSEKEGYRLEEEDFNCDSDLIKYFIEAIEYLLKFPVDIALNLPMEESFFENECVSPALSNLIIRLNKEKTDSYRFVKNNIRAFVPKDKIFFIIIKNDLRNSSNLDIETAGNLNLIKNIDVDNWEIIWNMPEIKRFYGFFGDYETTRNLIRDSYKESKILGMVLKAPIKEFLLKHIDNFQPVIVFDKKGPFVKIYDTSKNTISYFESLNKEMEYLKIK